MHRVTSLARKRTHLGPYRRPLPRFLGGSRGLAQTLSSHALLWLAESYRVDVLGVWFESVNFGAGKSLGSPNWRGTIDGDRATTRGPNWVFFLIVIVGFVPFTGGFG